VVSAFLDSVGGYRYKERRDQLLDILDVDLDWRMHQISDGKLEMLRDAVTELSLFFRRATTSTAVLWFDGPMGGSPS